MIGFFAAAMIALAASAAAADAATQFHPRIGAAMGIVPPYGRQEIATSPSTPIVYHGGPVMRGVTVHTVFWAPPGYQFEGPPGGPVAVALGLPGGRGYEQLIQQFFSDVAHDSGGSSNVFSVLGQYPDGSGSGTYNIAYDPTSDSIDDANPYPVKSQQCASPGGIAILLLARTIILRRPCGFSSVKCRPNEDCSVSPLPLGWRWSWRMRSAPAGQTAA